MKAVLESGEPIVTSDLIGVEFTSAVTRRVRAGRLASAERDAVLSLFAQTRIRFESVPVSEEILQGASELVLRRELRSLDAIQLASALSVKGDSPAPFRFGSGDAHLNAAAKAEGLELLAAG